MTDSNTSPATDAPSYQKKDRSKRGLVITVVLIAIAALVTAGIFWMNRGGDTPGGGNGTGGSGENGGGGETTPTTAEITIGLQLPPDNFDIRTTGGVALDQILIDNVYQGLIGLASGTLDEYVPVLAEALPEISDDGLTATVTLREGITFHSGNELTAQDVVDSLSATEGPASLSSALGSPVSVTAEGDRTVVISLTTPNSQLMWHLAGRPGLVFETAYEGDLASTVNGTGPFVLEQWNQGDSITFAAYPDYWGDEVALDRVVWRYIPDANAAINAALEGDLDVLAPVTPSLISQLERSDFELGRAASTDVFTLAFNNARPPLDDLRVRTALSQAIDSDEIIAAFYGDGKALGGPITDIEPAYEDLTAVNAYDPENARNLLAEAGVEGLELTLTVPNFYDLAPINQLVTQFEEIGVTLEVNPVEFSTWLSDVYMSRDFDLSYVNHAEPNDFGNYTNPGYYFGYDNTEVQSLFAQSTVATDPAQAVDLLKLAARHVAEDAPAKWLLNYTPTNAVASHVSGFPTSNTNSRINLASVTVN